MDQTHEQAVTSPPALLAAIRRMFVLGAKLGLLVLAGAALAAWLGRKHWAFELWSHFPMHVVLAGSLAAMVLLWGRQWPWLGLAAGLIAIHGWGLLPYLPTERPRPATLTVLLANVHSANTQYEKLLDLIAAERPDIVVVQEVNDDWQAALAMLHSEYPHQIFESRDDNFGIAMFSRLPMRASVIQLPRRGELPSILATITRADGRTLDVLATHPLPPIGRVNAQLRDDQLASVAEQANSAGEDLLIVGDLNATPWSPCFKSLCAVARVQDGRLGKGLNGTWPSRLPGCLKIPIDHVLWRGDAEVVEFRVGGRIGSDHRPVIAKVR